MSHKVPTSNAALMSRDVETLPTRPAVKFQDPAKLALADAQLRHNMGKATQTIRAKRARVIQELPDWEALREAGRAIKDRTLRHLEAYLLQLDEAITRAGGWCTGLATPRRPTGSSPASSRATERRKSSRSSR
jgi:L-lactate dehydrogenase complex protein LldF